MNPSPRIDPQAPGRMTAEIRAVAAPHGPRIPRIAVLSGGRIVAEHLVRDDEPITIGTSERARIVVRGAGLPERFELLERVGARWFLRFTDGMSGRVSSADGVVTLGEVREHETRDGAHRTLLLEDARGKIIVGETTFLFQLVPPPPVLATPRLPLGVRQGLGLDFGLTIIAAFSFLLHFGVAGALYSDWLDPVVASDDVVLGLVDDLARLPRPAPEPVPDPRIDTSSDSPTTASTANAPSARSPSARSTSTTSARTSTTDSQAASLAAQADRMEVDFLTARANGASVQRALDRSTVPPVDLSNAAAKNVGVTHDRGGLVVATGGPVGPSSNTLSSLGHDTHRNGPDRAGTENGPPGPTLTVDTPPNGMNGAISDADRVIAKLRPRFRKCYQDGLRDNPTMSGKATIAAKVGPNGEVLDAAIASNEGLSQATTSCLARVVSGAQFTGNGAVTTVRIPVSLLQQR